MQSRISEFKLWVVIMLIGSIVLSTEIVVKARRPATDVWREMPAGLPSAPAVVPELETVGNSEEPAEPTEELITSLLVESIIQIESAGKPGLVGAKGERGLMQIMAGTWRDTTRDLYGKTLSFHRAFEPALNREVGTAYLARLHHFLQQNRSEWRADERSLLLACYNAGPQRVAQANFTLKHLPVATRDYIARASALHDHYLQEHALRLAPADRFAMEIIQADTSLARDS